MNAQITNGKIIELALTSQEAHVLLRALETAHAAERTHETDRPPMRWMANRLQQIVRRADREEIEKLYAELTEGDAQ